MTALAILAFTLGQYVGPQPQPVGGPITYLQTNATLTASGSASFSVQSGSEVDVTYGAYGTFGGTSPAIQFCIEAVDPQNTAKVSAELNEVCSPTITAATAQANTIRLSPVGSSAYTVLWTIGGTLPSIGGVDLTVQVKPAKGAAALNQIKCTNVCCGTVRTALPASPLINRRSMIVQNKDTVMDCYVGDSSVSTSTGLWLVHGGSTTPGGSVPINAGQADQIYCVAATLQANGCVSVCESN